MCKTSETINPYTEEKLKTYNLLSSQEANQAVDNAHTCFKQWKLTTIEERAKLAMALAGSFEKHKEELLDLMVNEMGKVRAQGLQEIELCKQIC